MNDERKAVAAYLRDIADKVESGFAFEFEFRWRSGRDGLANLHVSPAGPAEHVAYVERKFAPIPHVAEICMAAGSMLVINEQLQSAQSVVAGTIDRS